jgi:putative phage-type endonuclease
MKQGKIIDTIEQGTEEWHLLRAGKVTSSKISDMMAKGKGSAESAGRRNYRAQLVAERLTGEVETDGYKNDAMQRGNDLEDAARSCYEFEGGQEVKQVAFILHPEIENKGSSPDGLVGEEGQIEIKCLNTANHIDILLKNVIPTTYLKQMHDQMGCSGRLWNDFVSYDPRMPEELQLVVIRLMRDQAIIDEINAATVDFLAEVDDMEHSMKIIQKRRA